MMTGTAERLGFIFPQGLFHGTVSVPKGFSLNESNVLLLLTRVCRFLKAGFLDKSVKFGTGF
jgi:hypothetical protein